MVDGLFPADVIESASAALRGVYPDTLDSPTESDVMERLLPAGDQGQEDSDSEAILEAVGSQTVDFPYTQPGMEACNDLLLHPRYIRAVTQLLGTDDVLMTQNHAHGKYGGQQGPDQSTRSGSSLDDDEFGDGVQPIHLDYIDNSLVVPPEHPEAVACIAYFSDVESCGGGTALVPLSAALLTEAHESAGYPRVGAGAEPFKALVGFKTGLRRGEAAQLYDQEQQVFFSPGTVLLYRLDVWHRGTAVLPGAVRRAAQSVYRRADAPWVQWESWAPKLIFRDSPHQGTGVLSRWFQGLEPEQRTVLGFPAPGASYWTAATLAGVGRRYPEMDMSAYEAEGDLEAAATTSRL